MTRINHENHFSWQEQYLVRLAVGPRVVNDASYVTRINHENIW